MRVPRAKRMKDDHEQLDPIEQLLREFNDASEAGVFKATAVDTTAALSPVRSWSLARRVLATAAVLAFAAGAWTTFTRVPLGPDSGDMLLASANPYAPMAAQLDACMKGPSASVLPANCRGQDHDADNDFDLRDVSSVMASIPAAR